MSVAELLPRVISKVDQLGNDRKQPDGILTWPIPPALSRAPEVTLRNGFAEHLATRSVDEIVQRHVYMSTTDMAGMMRLAQRYVLPEPFRGHGIELGAGCGLLSATVAKASSVRTIFAVEVCRRTAELLIPRVSRAVLGKNAHKVLPVAGSFDDLRLADSSLDFAVEIDSLHHSGNLRRSLSECARVLKPGGTALLFDRCRSNEVTDAEVDVMLSKTYSREFLIANAYPPDIVLTRRENGEHEYRLFEWLSAFAAAGFRLERKCEFRPSVSARRAIKGVLSLLPQQLRSSLYKTDNATPRTTVQWLGQTLRAATINRRSDTYFCPKRKRTTVFLLRKNS